MEKFKEAWGKMTPPERFNFVVMTGLSVVVLILCLLSFLKVLPTQVTNRFVMPLLGVLTIFYGFKSLKRKKGTGMFIIVCGLFVLGVTFINLF